jgi:hypothetical protein
LNQHEVTLKENLRESERLFGTDFMKYVRHTLFDVIHIVRKHGILSLMSTFPYESLNHNFMTSYNWTEYSLTYFDLKQQQKQVKQKNNTLSSSKCYINGFSFAPSATPKASNYICILLHDAVYRCYGWIVEDNYDSIIVKFEEETKRQRIYPQYFDTIYPGFIIRNEKGEIENRRTFLYWTKLFIVNN